MYKLCALNLYACPCTKAIFMEILLTVDKNIYKLSVCTCTFQVRTKSTYMSLVCAHECLILKLDYSSTCIL